MRIFLVAIFTHIEIFTSGAGIARRGSNCYLLTVLRQQAPSTWNSRNGYPVAQQAA